MRGDGGRGGEGGFLRVNVCHYAHGVSFFPHILLMRFFFTTVAYFWGEREVVMGPVIKLTLSMGVFLNQELYIAL